MVSEIDDIDARILALLQENCKMSLSKIGERVGLSAPSVIERIKKLEEGQVIIGYRAILDARKLDQDVAAFIGVSVGRTKAIEDLETAISQLDDLLECHHVTGEHTLLLKVKTKNTNTLEDLLSRIRSIEGVDRTETMVVLSTHTERTNVALKQTVPSHRRSRKNGDKRSLHLKGV